MVNIQAISLLQHPNKPELWACASFQAEMIDGVPAWIDRETYVSREHDWKSRREALEEALAAIALFARPVIPDLHHNQRVTSTDILIWKNGMECIASQMECFIRDADTISPVEEPSEI